MRIEVARNQLARLLTQTTRAVESRNTIPILACVRIVVADGKLTATATDLDVEVRGSIATTSLGGEGAFCVDAKLFAGIVGKLSSDAVGIDVEAGKITVFGGRSKFKLQTLPVEDFPNLTGPAVTTALDIDLAALVAPTAFAISTEETRFYLNGVYFVGDGKAITAVATDGHRLSRHRIEQAEEFKGVILPRKFVGMLPKGVVRVELSGSQVRLTAPGDADNGETVITSKLIDGTFPDYERVIPTGNTHVIIADRDAIVRAADRVSVVSSERGKAVKMSFAAGQALLAVRGDGDEASDELEVEYDGEPIDIGFNGRYISDVLSIFPAGKVRLAIEPNSPAVVTSDAAPGLLAVIMPMRVT